MKDHIEMLNIYFAVIIMAVYIELDHVFFSILSIQSFVQASIRLLCSVLVLLTLFKFKPDPFSHLEDFLLFVLIFITINAHEFSSTMLYFSGYIMILALRRADNRVVSKLIRILVLGSVVYAIGIIIQVLIPEIYTGLILPLFT